jgi:3-isopropylmalate/(R)-2-methylmalate dehydratase small subunit
VSATGWGDGLFAAKRYLDGPGHTPDPDFILNQAPYNRAAILISGSNFGCGSSRESAVWALRDYGFRVIVAVSFNETFKRNCIVNGLAPLVVGRPVAERLAAAATAYPAAGVAVDLAQGALATGRPPERFSFELDPFYAALLTSGRSEDDLLGVLRLEIDAARERLLLAWPWLRSGGG